MTNEPQPIPLTDAVRECEEVADKISDGIKRAMPCDCRAQGSRVRCGACGVSDHDPRQAL